MCQASRLEWYPRCLFPSEHPAWRLEYWSSIHVVLFPDEHPAVKFIICKHIEVFVIYSNGTKRGRHRQSSNESEDTAIVESEGTGIGSSSPAFIQESKSACPQ